MSATVPVSELFDAEFLSSLEHLRIVARRVVRGGRFAEHPSRDQGAGIEFQDYRPYAAGDDLRAVDWNIYRRLGRVFIRLFEEQEDLPLYLLPDVSASAFHETPPRARAGLRATLALAAISLGQHDRVGLFPFADDLAVDIRPTAGRSRLMRFAEHLARLQPGGPTDMVKSMSRFAGLGLRQGLVAVVSDFFDPGGIDAVVEGLGMLRHQLLLVQLVRTADRDPDLDGDLRLVDCETGAEANVSVGPAALERYRAAYDRFETGLEELALRRHAGLLRLDVEAEVVPQLAALFESGSYVV